jgi:hypothetical protein
MDHMSLYGKHALNWHVCLWRFYYDSRFSANTSTCFHAPHVMSHHQAPLIIYTYYMSAGILTTLGSRNKTMSLLSRQRIVLR